VRATTVTAADWRCRSKIVPPGYGLAAGLFLGFRKPKFPILGTQLSGEIEAVGKGVTRFKVGDQVFAYSALSMGCHRRWTTCGSSPASQSRGATGR
jgi:NADPH:quinone reductase-like Zn-dependent oxidoreductase